MNLVFIASSYSHLALFNEAHSKLSCNNNIYCFTLNKDCKSLLINSEVLSLKRNDWIKTIQATNPDFILLDASDHYKVIASIIKWAKLKSIKTICMMNHRKRLDKDFQLLEQPDYILTPNDKVAKNYQKKSNVVLFKPFAAEWVGSKSYKYTKTVNFDKPNIMYISQNNKPFYTYFLINLYRRAIPKQHRIYIKEHYNDKKREWGRFSSPYKKMEEVDTESVINQMMSFDLIIGDDSELLFIASALGIPTIFMTLDYKDDFFNFFHKHKFKKHFIPEAYRGKKASFIDALSNILKEKTQ